MKTLRPALLAIVAFGVLAFTSACLPNVNLPRDLAVTSITTGWFDAGIVKSPEGDMNKLVPSISFALTNKAPVKVVSVQINAVFKLVGDEEELGSAWVKGIGAEGLAPGAATEPMVLRCPLGFTGLQPRAQMFENKLFRDARVFVYAKYGSATWVKLGEYRITRQLLTR
jgi:hypothetical protein